MRWVKWQLVVLAALLTTKQAEAAPDVVTSIKPVHGLVSAVMGELGTPSLIVDGSASPHDFALKPSNAQALADADLVFWIGDSLETFLVKPIQTIAQQATSISLVDTPDLTLLTVDDDDHDHGHSHGHDHEDKAIDPHVWLDPQNAQLMVMTIADALSKADPHNADIYDTNARQAQKAIDQLSIQIDQVIEPLRNAHYVVFHDAYRYFESRYQLANSGTITLNPEISPSAQRIVEIQEAIKNRNAVCVFAEPQFDEAIVNVVTEGTKAQTGILDPLGANLKPGAELYFELMGEISESFRNCLSLS